MHRLILSTFLTLFLLTSCAESLEEQGLRILEDDRSFEIDLEVRKYEFGYLVSTENDPDRPQQNVFDETIFLTTEQVNSAEGLLTGSSQVIGVEIRYISTEIPQEVTTDLSRFAPSNPRVRTRVFVGEDFNFSNGSARRKEFLNTGEVTVRLNSNGSRTISINARFGSFPLKGTWSGDLEDAQVRF